MAGVAGLLAGRPAFFYAYDEMPLPPAATRQDFTVLERPAPMRNMKITSVGVAVLAAFATPAHAADEKTFAIHFDRPATAGQKFSLAASEIVRTRQKIELPDGGANSTDKLKRVTLDADVRVDKCDDKGHDSQNTLIIKTLTMQLDGQTRELLKPGTQLTLVYEGTVMIFTQKSGEKLPDDADAGLRQIFKAQREQTLAYDSIYGTPLKKAVGDSWPVSPAALATDIQLPGAIDPKQVTGTVVLKAVKPVAGIECVQIEAALVANNVPVEGAQPKESTLSVSLACSQPRITSHTVIEQQPQGRGIIRYTLDSETTHAATWTPKP